MASVEHAVHARLACIRYSRLVVHLSHRGPMMGADQIKCSEPNCTQSATAHATLLIGRLVAGERYFCEPHCQDYFKSSIRLVPRGDAPPRITDGAVECDLSHILTRPSSDADPEQQYLHLREIGGRRWLSLMCGAFEAAMMLKTIKFPEPSRPTPFDLAVEIASALGGSIEFVIVDEYIPSEKLYLASVAVKGHDGQQFIDARPSDAISLAIRCSLPILVSERILVGA
jgi:uncharacterized protein